MAEDQDIQEPEVADAPPQIGGGQPQPPAKLMLSDASRQKLDSIVSKMVANKEKDSDIQAVVNDFKQKYATPPAPSMATASAPPPPPEHQIQHDPIQDIRHVQEMAAKPATGYSTAIGGMGGAGTYQPDEASLAQSKAYQDQYTKMATDLGATWGAKPEAVKQVLTDFPDEQDPDKLKANAALLNTNPAAYSRLKNANDIRQAMAKDGPNGVHDANVFNYLQNAQNYQQLTEENIPYQQQLMRQHNLESQLPQLEATQRPLINSLDLGLNQKYWNSADKELGLTLDEYAGLETERLFNPNKAAMDLAILKHSRGIGEDGKANPLDMSTQPYTYQRGVENVKYNLAQNGRQNLAMYIAEKKPDLDKQVNDLAQQYQSKMATATPAEQQQLVQQFNQEPAVLQANDIENGKQQLEYSESEDSRLYPLNFNDKATRIVRDAMQSSGFQGSDIPNVANKVASGFFNTEKGTWDFVKNLAINIAGNDEQKAFNNAESQGEKSITDLTGYLGAASSGVEQPLNVPRGTISAIQGIWKDPDIHTDAERMQESIKYLKNNWDELTANPKAGQQNLTGKSLIYGAADMTGQILGIASQSFLMGGAIGDASKMQRLASTFTPMYMSTQDQLYQQAVKDGKEHPLMESNMDAAIISLASLINPDINVVKRAAGMDSPIGKMIAGVSEDTWNKVLSTNKPILDQMSAGIKGTARQMGLAQLQYGLIAPVGQYIVHKGILNEDANLPDMIKDGVVNTAIQMAAPALLHGLWGGVKATDVNPMQKYSLVEAGLKPDQNIDIVDNQIKTGQISEVQGHQIKQLIKHAGEFMLDPNLKMTDGTPMNEQQVADNLYNSIKKKALETSLKTAPEPLKPVIQEKIHEVNKEITDGFTSDADKHTAELNQLLHDNLDRIKDKAPEMEQKVKDAIKQNTPEDIYKQIADEAKETKSVEGKEVSNRDEVEKVYGKPLVEKAIELSNQKPKANGKNETDAQTEGQVEKPTEGAESPAGTGSAPSIHPNSRKIKLLDKLRTWFLGDMEGKPEDDKVKKHLEGVVDAWDKKPATDTSDPNKQGETFGEFIKRVIPTFKNILDTEVHNTTLVTHSSVLKAFKVWDEMGRPDVDNLTAEQKKTFADKYNATETQNGDLDTFKGTNGDIHVIRHGETVDNEKNNLRSGNTMLTAKGKQDAANAGQALKDKTGGDVPQIITSDLPRAVDSSNIINDKLNENATSNTENQSGEANPPISEQGAADGQPQPTSPEPASPNNPEGAEQGVGRTGGIAQRVKEGRESETGVKAPAPGKLATTQELVDIGRRLIKEGRDPEKEIQNFEADPDKNISTNAIGVVRARLEDLQKATDRAIDKHGEDSKEADAARKLEEEWAARIKPMQTEWSGIGKAQMGDTDLDTGSVASLKRAFKAVSDKPLTEKQSQTASELRSKLKQHEDRISDLETQLDKVRKQEPSKSTTFTEKTKKAADVFRKLKTKEFTFKDSNGNDVPIQKMGVGWNDLVELGAKAIEKTGEIADGIAAILEKVKDADWYKGLSKEDKDRFGKELEDHYTSIADKKEGTRIKALEKQLADLEAGNIKENGAKRTPSSREQELRDQIFEAKKNLGLIKSKATPTPKTPIDKPTIDIARHFIGKKDNTFTTQESNAIWEHTKQVIKDGKEDFHAVVNQVAMDTGLSRDQVNHAIEQPKGAKGITNKIYAETYRRNQVKQAAQIWVKTANQSATKKFWNAAIKVPSAIVTALHGTVAPATHVGGDLYRPTNWKSYFTFMANSYKYAFGGMTDAGKATYEKNMNELVKDPMYLVAKKAGAKVDPTDLSGDDYSKYQGVFGRLSKMGERGFNAMKPYRLEQFKKLYNGLSDQAKGNDDVLKTIGNIVNLSSGTTSVKTGKYTDVAIFAPKLITSQYQRIFSEPVKAIGTFTQWGASIAAPDKVSAPTDAQKLQATMVARHVGEMMTTYLAGLAANQAILVMTGSKQRINFNNPLDPDWMRFKMAGKDVDVSGGMNSSLRFVASLAEEGLRANGVIKTAEKGKPGDSEGRKILQQAANKLSPLASDIVEGFSTTDNAGNPLPWSSVKPSAGRAKLTWGEYFESKSPIFISEGFKAFNDAAKSNPQAKSALNNYLEGVVIGVLAGTTGAKIQPDKQKPTTTGRR